MFRKTTLDNGWEVLDISTMALYFAEVAIAGKPAKC